MKIRGIHPAKVRYFPDAYYWIYNPWFMEYKCSRCGEAQSQKSNYCPYCGAEMVRN